MKKFNLMQIIPSLESGGVERGTVDLANFLAKKNIESSIVSNGGKMQIYLDKRKINHYKLPVNSKNFFKMPFIAKKLNKQIIENKINVVHIRSRAPAWILKFIKNKSFKSVSTFHNVYGMENYFKKYYNNQLSKVDYITAISKYVKSEISKNYNINPNKITVIKRGIDTDFFNSKINESDLSDFISKFNISLDKKIILFPGRLTEWKGQINFLNVIESIKDKNIICYFVGDDKNKSYTSRLVKEINKKRINENCKIIGNLNMNDLKMIYLCSNIIVSAPLKPEGFGRIISEGLAMKKIVLSYNFGGAYEQIINLDDLFKVTPNNQEEMKNKIIKILTLSKNSIENLGIVSRDHIIKNFSKNTMLSSYLNFYNKVAK